MAESKIVRKGSSGGGSVKSVQKGILASSSDTVNIPISAIDQDSSIPIIKIWSDTISNLDDSFFKAVITSPTNLQVSRRDSGAGSYGVAWQVVEYDNVKSLQSGLKVDHGPSGTFVSQVVNAVDEAKSIVVSSNDNASPISTITGELTACHLNTPTELRFQHASGTNEKTTAWYLIEFN